MQMGQAPNHYVLQTQIWLGSIKVLSRSYQGSIKVLSRFYQGPIKVLSRCYQGAIKELSRFYQGAIKVLSRFYQGAIKVLSHRTFIMFTLSVFSHTLLLSLVSYQNMYRQSTSAPVRCLLLIPPRYTYVCMYTPGTATRSVYSQM